MVSSVFVVDCVAVDEVAVAFVSVAVTEDTVVAEVELTVVVSVVSSGVAVVD